MKRFIPAAGLPLLLVAARCSLPAASACGDDGLVRRAPRGARAWTASTPRPPTACCASRSSWARGRPGSRKSRRLAARLRRLLPEGRYQAVPGGLRNVVGRVPGRGRGLRGAGRALRHEGHARLRGRQRRRLGHGRRACSSPARSARAASGVPSSFVLFDGEESPRGTPDARFAQKGLRGSKVAAPRFRDARAMVLLDFVGNRRLRIPREGSSDAELWRTPPRRGAAGRGRAARSPRRPAGACSTTTSRSSSRACPPST